MSRFRRFFLILLVALGVGIPATATVDFFWKQKDIFAEAIITTFNARPCDVLYFGDSTLRFSGDRDKDKTGIDEFFRARSARTVCTIASPGFSGLLFSQYVRLLEKTRHRPRVVIIPINLRGFSDSGVKRPSIMFPLRQVYIRYRASGRFEWKDYLAYRFLGREDALTEAWYRLPVFSGGVNLGTNREVLQASRINEVIDYEPEREALYARQLALKFRYHYLMDLRADNVMLASLRDTATTLEKMGIRVLFYATPINMQDGVKYVGREFEEQVSASFRLIFRQLNTANASVLDLHALLPAERFVHKKDVFEHLDTEGRRIVGERVADELLKLDAGSGPREGRR